MALRFHPRVGMILECDFSQGFKEPEMVKKRPVLVLRTKGELVTVVALSTKEPSPIEKFHYAVPKQSMPQIGRFQKKDTWLKGDMIYTVGFHRLDLIRLNKRDPNTGRRVYFQNRLGGGQMKTIKGCVLHGIGMGDIVGHL